MDLNNFTIKSREAIQTAQQIALEFGNQSIEPEHLLEGIFRIDNDISVFLLKKSGLDSDIVKEKNIENLKKLSKVDGGNIYISQTFNNVLLTALALAKKMGDEFVTIEHLWLSLLEVNSSVSKMLKNFGITKKTLEMEIKELRKGNKAVSVNAEENYRSLSKYAKNLCKLASEGRLDPVIGRDEEIRRVLQILSTRSWKNCYSGGNCT